MLGETDLEDLAESRGVETGRDGDSEPLPTGDQEPVDLSDTGPDDRVGIVLGRAGDPGAATDIQVAGAENVSAAQALMQACAAPLQILVKSGGDHQAVPERRQQTHCVVVVSAGEDRYLQRRARPS